MPELALDHDERNALLRHLNRVRAPQLVRGEPPTDPGSRCRMVQLLACCGGLSAGLFRRLVWGYAVGDSEETSDVSRGGSCMLLVW